MKELTGTLNGHIITMDEWVYKMMLELNARLSDVKMDFKAC
jgi:hypothetical protein